MCWVNLPTFVSVLAYTNAKSISHSPSISSTLSISFRWKLHLHMIYVSTILKSAALSVPHRVIFVVLLSTDEQEERELALINEGPSIVCQSPSQVAPSTGGRKSVTILIEADDDEEEENKSRLTIPREVVASTSADTLTGLHIHLTLACLFETQEYILLIQASSLNVP